MDANNLPDLSQLSFQLGDLIMPWLMVLFSLIVIVWVKNVVESVVRGLLFQFDKSFNEGDHVILDNEPATIIKIGLSNTVFGVYSDRGYTWRYVPNEMIARLKLEKVIDKNLHPDSVEEQGARIQRLIDAAQDDSISKNKTASVRNAKAIEELKNGNQTKK
jgi:hypothetical protein